MARRGRLSSALADFGATTMDRRTFLRRSGVAAGSLAALSAASGGMVQKAQAQAATAGKVDIKKSVCTHCSVGCTVLAEVKDGVWIGQEPGFDSPFNLGSHCAKGASVREHAHGERRLKYPTKLVNGKWERISWDQAIEELPHAVTAQGDLGADGLALAELESGDRLAREGDDRLLPGDEGEVGDGVLEQRGLLGGASDTHVDDDLLDRGDLHDVVDPELALEVAADLLAVADLQAGHGGRTHLITSPEGARFSLALASR